jgi:RHS repeat-associated protein
MTRRHTRVDSQFSLAAFGVSYTYSGDGERVLKSNGKAYWYDNNGRVLSEADLNGNITDEYIYFGSIRIAHWSSTTNAVTYYIQDALGSTRAIVDSSGSPCFDADFFPYGGEFDFVSTCSPSYKFTAKERDSESSSSTDYFGARYYSTTLGRWKSPDLPFADQVLTDPQSWNLYGFVRNNPESSIDTNGRVTWVIGGTKYNPKDYAPNSPFVQSLRALFNDDDVELIPWSGGDSVAARAQLAQSIEAAMSAHVYAPGEQNNVVTHSHAGNAFFAAVPSLRNDGFYIDNLVTLGLPIRGDYYYDTSIINNWFNVYTPNDIIQKLGGRIPGFGGRTNPNATNIRVLSHTNFLAAHSSLHKSPQVIAAWELLVRSALSNRGAPDANPDPPIPAYHCFFCGL